MVTNRNFRHYSFLLRLVFVLMLVFNGGLVQEGFAITPDFIVANKGLGQDERNCPSSDFNLFFDAFSNNDKVQRIFTEKIIAKQYLDLNSEPEPKPIVKRFASKSIGFPIFPLKKEREEKRLTVQIGVVTQKKASAILIQSDTDYQVVFYFIKRKCWMLERIEDWSL